jgi:hypothetical protein
MAYLARALTVIFVMTLAASPSVSVAQQGATLLEQPRLDGLLGREVTIAGENGDSGRIIDLLVDDSGQLKAAVVEFGGFLGIGTRKIAVNWTAFRFGGPKIVVDVSRDDLRRTPEYKSKEAPILVGAPEQ